MARRWLWFNATGNVTVALTGVSATGQVQSPVPSNTVPLVNTNTYATGTLGTVVANNSIPLTNTSVFLTGNIGSVVSSSSIPLTNTNANATGNVGTVVANNSVPITNTSAGATGQVGTVVPDIGVSVALTTVSATGAVGTVVPDTSVPLTTVNLTGEVGTVTPVGNVTVALTSVSTTGQVGTLAPDTNILLVTNSATGQVGTTVPSLTTSISGVSLTGTIDSVLSSCSLVLNNTSANATGAIGSLTPSTTVPLTKNDITGQVGSVTFSGDVTTALTGVYATGQVGTVVPSGGTGGTTYCVDYGVARFGLGIGLGVSIPNYATLDGATTSDGTATYSVSNDTPYQVSQANWYPCTGSGPMITSIILDRGEANYNGVGQLYFGTSGSNSGVYLVKSTFLADHIGLTLQDFSGIASPGGTAAVPAFTGFTPSGNNLTMLIYDDTAYTPAAPYCVLQGAGEAAGQLIITFDPPISSAGMNINQNPDGGALIVSFYNGATLLHEESIIAQSPNLMESTFVGYSTGS